MTKVAIIIPTYNEARSIQKLIQEMVRLPLDKKIIIVDDNSPDGTGEVADKLSRKYKEVSVIHRLTKSGRGSAVMEGLKTALSDPKIKFLIEMDADFLHQPKDIPRLLEQARHFDVVVASRYLPGSKILGRSLARRSFSFLANLWARLLLGIPIGDYTNGFRCYTRPALEKLNFDDIKTTGYITLSEVAYKLYKRGVTFGEVPCVFVITQKGRTNFNFEEVYNAFVAVLKLRLGLI